MGACVSSTSDKEKQSQQATHTAQQLASQKSAEQSALPGSQHGSQHIAHPVNGVLPVSEAQQLTSPQTTQPQDGVGKPEPAQPTVHPNNEHKSSELPTTEQQQLIAVANWQKQHEVHDAELRQQLLLQSQEISKLRDQVIDLQAFRQQQQRQHQRAAYVKSKMFPSLDQYSIHVPSDCCATAMACCLAIEEMKSDLKMEGQIISRQFEALLDTQKHCLNYRPTPFSPASILHQDILMTDHDVLSSDLVTRAE